MQIDKQSEKEPRVVLSNSSIRDWQGLEAELEQSLAASMLAIDLLKQIISSLQVSGQCLREQQLHTMEEYE